MLALLLLCALCAAAGATATDTRLPLRIGKHTFQVEIAATPLERKRGLMGIPALAAHGGMLFVFEHAARHCFWMRNTPLPLSIAFIDDAGRIVNITEMQPHTDTLHCPASAIRYALEVPQGGFRQRGIEPGVQVDGLPQ